jgi:short-subunit dehydrogenase
LPLIFREDSRMQRTALITGASSGIGEAAAKRLARDYRVIVLARREDRLKSLAAEIGGDYIAADLTDEDAPARIAEQVGDELHLLVNNAGAAWRGRFADGGFENVRRHMELNFDAQLRLTEALLPLLRASAPSAIVNVASVAGRISRANSAAYSASKFALIGWSDGLHLEEREHGVHVGLVLPGFVATEGFPQKELVSKPLTRWAVSTPEKLADAIADAAAGKAERYSPRPYALVPVLRSVAPGLLRWASKSSSLTPKTNSGTGE